jgi:hypothetical protein
MKHAVVVVVGSGLGVLAAGSCVGPGSALCDAECECQICNDREREECEITYDTYAEASSAYGCDEDFDAWRTCALEEAQCDDYTWKHQEKCGDELKDWYKCLDDSSDLNPIPGIGTVQPTPEDPPPGTGSGGGPTGGKHCECSCTCASCTRDVSRDCASGDPACESCGALCKAECTAGGCGALTGTTGGCL